MSTIEEVIAHLDTLKMWKSALNYLRTHIQLSKLHYASMNNLVALNKHVYLHFETEALQFMYFIARYLR